MSHRLLSAFKSVLLNLFPWTIYRPLKRCKVFLLLMHSAISPIQPRTLTSFQFVFAVYFEKESSPFVCLQKRVGISLCLWHISYKTWKVLGELSFPVWYTCDLQLFTSFRVRVSISFFSISGKLWPLKFRNVFGAKSLSEHVNKRYNVTVAKSGNTEHAVVGSPKKTTEVLSDLGKTSTGVVTIASIWAQDFFFQLPRVRGWTKIVSFIHVFFYESKTNHIRLYEHVLIYR